MFNYQGVQCPYCGLEFTENDDIAVCPECGTPHHRHCFHENGQCFNLELHSDTFEWTNNATEQVEESHQKNCPFCGHEISKDAFVCPYCGRQIPQEMPGYTIRSILDLQEEERKRIAEETGRFVLKSDDLIDGVTVRDLLLYFKNIDYVAVFCKQEFSHRKISFCLPALFSPALFFLYNKAWIEGLCALFLSFILSVPDGMIVLYRMTGTLFLNIPLASWDKLSDVFSIISIVINLLFALYGFYILRQSAIRKIKKIRSKNATEEEYRMEIDKCSPPSRLVIFFIVLYIILLVVSLLFL